MLSFLPGGVWVERQSPGMAAPVSGLVCAVSGELISPTSGERRPLCESQRLSNMTSGIKDHNSGFRFQKEVYSLMS